MATISEEIREKIDGAEMVLVGLGEEFQCPECARKLPEYEKGKEALQKAGYLWMVPAWDDYCGRKAKSDVCMVLGKFADILAEKNYFVVSVAMNDYIVKTPWRPGRLVMPCGGSRKLQCRGKCNEEPVILSADDSLLLEEIMEDLYRGEFMPEKAGGFGKCKSCNTSMVLNNIYAENYNENGYLEQWNLYMKWLQGTLNRRVTVLELGVGMRFPSVIRFPFEKVAYFNRKAQFYRINEKLYHLTEELKEIGQGISQNAIDCLRNL